MARQVRTIDGGSVVTQGFRPGGGKDSPYVYVTSRTSNGQSLDEYEMTTEQARELGEALRLEAEFAESERKEGSE